MPTNSGASRGKPFLGGSSADTKDLFSGAEFRTLPMVYGRVGTTWAAALAGQQVVQAFSVIVQTLRAMLAGRYPRVRR
jgi:hypothetical protein